MKRLYILFVFLFILVGTVFVISSQSQNWDVEKSLFITEGRSLDNLRHLKSENSKQYNKVSQLLKKIDLHYRNQAHRENSSVRQTPLIPKELHFIWVGPHELPQRYLDNITTWHQANPDYNITLWVDRERNIPYSYINVKDIETIGLKLKRRYNKSATFAEKSNIIRYEVLNNYGGIYSDIDVVCHKSFDPLVNAYEFFIGMEDVWPMVENHYLKTCNAVVGSKPHHPIWPTVIKKIDKNWKKNSDFVQKLSMDWVLNDYLKLIRSFKRSSLPFTDTVLHYHAEKSVIVPPNYFGMRGTPPQKGIYCTHLYDGTWKGEESEEAKAKKTHQ